MCNLYPFQSEIEGKPMLLLDSTKMAEFNSQGLTYLTFVISLFQEQLVSPFHKYTLLPLFFYSC